MALCVRFITDGKDLKCGHTVVILMYTDGFKRRLSSHVPVLTGLELTGRASAQLGTLITSPVVTGRSNVQECCDTRSVAVTKQVDYAQ